jgi:hypothetical protein
MILAIKTKLLTAARKNNFYKATTNMQGHYELLLSNVKQINLGVNAKPIKN